jgi:hypothetical protein
MPKLPNDQIFCAVCGDKHPAEFAKEGKYCLGCHIIKFSVEREGGDWDNIEKGLRAYTHCYRCYRKLVPIGTARKNGKGHDDWDNRKYHKKCWGEITAQNQ